MPYANDQAGDFEKLQTAFTELTAMFGSFEGLLAAFGLSDMPQAQRYGIMFGCCVFFFTLTAVIGLLILGGSFKRIQQQAETGEATLLSPADARAQRALLLERLLQGRERMVRNYPEPPRTEDFTGLTTMLMNVAPNTHEIAELVHKDSNNGKKKQEIRRYIPPMYEENYLHAYRKCQDRPGGKTTIFVLVWFFDCCARYAVLSCVCVFLFLTPLSLFSTRHCRFGTPRGSLRSLRPWLRRLWCLHECLVPSFLWPPLRSHLLHVPRYR